MPTGDVEGGIFHGALGKAHVGGKRARYRAVPAKGKWNVVALAARHEISEVKGVNVMAFDDVRVAVPDELDEVLQHLGLGAREATDDVVPATVVGKGNSDNAVGFALGVGKGLTGKDFNVEL